MKSSLTPPSNAPRPPVVHFDPDAKFFNPSTSCSIDDAVAKLLGWLSGSNSYKYIEVTSGGITVDMLKRISSLECTVGGTLTSQLTELHQAALINFDNAKDGADKDAKSDAVLDLEKQFDKAAEYLRDIDEELAMGDDSKLKIDAQKTKDTGKLYITLNSLDRWARKEYKISILEIDESNDSNNDCVSNKDIVSHFPEEDEITRKINNVYITLALLVEAFSRTAPKYRINDKPKYDAIAEQIGKLAKAANHNNEVDAQNKENLRKLFSAAINIKEKSKLTNTTRNGISILQVEQEDMPAVIVSTNGRT